METPARLHAEKGLEEQGALADPRLAAHQDDRAGDQTPAQHPVQLLQTGVDASAGAEVDVG